MGNKLYVGNLAYSVTSESLSTMFTPFGAVESAQVITDRDSGRSKGFGFVEMSNSDEAAKCINELNGKEFEGRALNVSEAKPRESRSGSGGGGGGRGFGNSRGFGRGGGGRSGGRY